MTTPKFDTTHECPCGCRGRVPRHQLACKPGWSRLPADLRNAINGTYYTRVRARGEAQANAIRAHREAIVAAFIWYRDHPRPS